MQKGSISTLPTILTIFGATGDLTKRKLIPALFELYAAGSLPQMMHVVGFARRPLSDEDFQAHVREVLAGVEPAEKVEEFSRMFSYRAGDFTQRDSYESLAALLGKQDDSWNTCANKLFHLAVPPEHYKGILENLAHSGLTIPCGGEEGWTRVIVEKPFGKDLATAQELDELLGTLFQEEQIYRIDHYLGKDTVQNILAFRFSNAFLQPAWNAKSIASIHVRLFEDGDVSGRGAFYDGVGALRDVGQNHMLQLLALFTMDNPGAFDADTIRRARAEVLEGLEIMDVQDVARHTVRGQYSGYADEAGVATGSATETYFKVEARLNVPQWRGVPIILESGKAVAESKVEVVVEFRHHTPCLCPAGTHFTNVLRYEVQPNEKITTSFWAKKPGPEMVVEEKAFSFDYGTAFSKDEALEAYSRLLLDAIEGNQTSFVSTEEITASWNFIDPIIHAWGQQHNTISTYEKGSKPESILLDVPNAVIPEKTIGYIGLGKMGANMVERLLDYNWNIVAYDPDSVAREAAKAAGAKVVSSAAEVIVSMQPSPPPSPQLGRGEPRIVWIMVPHQAVDEVLAEVTPHLQAGDIVIEGGNSFYKDSIRRGEALQKLGVHYLDIGVSGGPSGARKGASLMIGGEKAAYKQLLGLFSDISVAGGYDYMGSSGAGHFVKMVHNGIEYGMMQAIAEGFAVLKEWRDDIDVERVAHLYNNGSVIESRLIHWLKDAYEIYGDSLESISGSVAHSGEGKWTVETAKELGIPVPIIEGAFEFRLQSQDNPSYTGKIVSALRNQFGGHDVKK